MLRAWHMRELFCECFFSLHTLRNLATSCQKPSAPRTTSFLQRLEGKSEREAREILSMPKENADWILAKLDPSVKLESLVSNMTPYQGLEPIEGSLEMAPSKAHPDSPEGLSLPAYDAGLAASRK